MRKTLTLTLLVLLFLSGCNLNNSNEVNNFDLKNRCATQAQSFLQNERANDITVNVINDQFAYNSTLNTCLVYFEVVEQGAGTTYNIFDLLTNKKLYTHVEYLDSNTQKWWDESCKESNGCFVKKEDFTAKFNNLFK